LLIILFSQLIFTVALNQSIKGLRRCFLKSRGNVAIGVKRHLNTGVSQPLLHYFGVYSLLKH